MKGFEMKEDGCVMLGLDIWREYSTRAFGKKSILAKLIEEKGIRRSVFNGGEWQTELWKNYRSPSDSVRIYDQGKTDRCWIYAALTVIEDLLEKKGIDVGSLSANYVSFFDIFEKSNFFLQFVIENCNIAPDERSFAQKLSSPVRDAGQWQFFCNIVKKYGLVPIDAMPDTKTSSDSRELIDVLSDILREFAVTLHVIHTEEGTNKHKMLEEKQAMLECIYDLLSSCLGNPPSKLDLPENIQRLFYTESDPITPVLFFEKCLGQDSLDEYCVIVNFPQKSKLFYKKYNVEWMGNVWGMDGGIYINVPNSELKACVKKQLDAKLPVWIGCDSVPYSDAKSGIYSLDNYDLKRLGYRYALLDKGKNLDFGLSRPRHAMVLRGYTEDEKYWFLQNSYGMTAGNRGYILVSDEWFELYVYEAVVNRSFMDDSILQCVEGNNQTLKPWDVLGTLA